MPERRTVTPICRRIVGLKDNEKVDGPALPPGPESLSRTEWRARADEPKGFAGWWWRGVWESGAGLTAIWFVAVAAAMTSGEIWIILLAALLGPLIHGVLRAFFSRDDLRPMLPEPAPADQFRGSVIFLRDGMTTGTDDVALTVVDGWLFVEGTRSHFSLAARDIGRLQTWSDRTGLLTLSDGSEVKLLGIPNEARIALEAWHRSQVEPLGKSSFPPASVHRQQFARWASYCVLGFFFSQIADNFPWGTHVGLAYFVGRYGSWLLALCFALIGFWRVWRLMMINARMSQRAAANEVPATLGRRLEEDRTEVRISSR
jgi:hypothetical protein